MHYTTPTLKSAEVWGLELGYKHRVVASLINLVTGGTEIGNKSWALFGLARTEG
jgi:hypothetical protein